VRIHTTATWPARDDRRAALVWLGLFWVFVGVGFGFDLHNYLHEQPAVPTIVHVHAIATTLWLLTATALVLMVETGNVRLHRRMGWFAAGLAALILVIAPWSEMSWQALNLQTPGALPPEFLSLAFSGVLCMALLLPWGILLRRNSAAHRRVLILATICISDAGFSRMMGLFLPAPTRFWGTYFFYEGGNVAIILLMFVWDWYRGRMMKQFVGGFADCGCGADGDGTVLQSGVADDLAWVAGELGAAHALRMVRVDIARGRRNREPGAGRLRKER
jgi:uncharacterized membrane protein YozB (DUF420 family)